jgi:hypothetical protein
LRRSIHLSNKWQQADFVGKAAKRFAVQESDTTMLKKEKKLEQQVLWTYVTANFTQQNLRNRVSMSCVINHWNDPQPYSNATYYSYDIHGNVDKLLQHYQEGVMVQQAYNEYKLMTYSYDLISGKVNEVAYQCVLSSLSI